MAVKHKSFVKLRVRGGSRDQGSSKRATVPSGMAGFVGDSRRLKGRKEELQNSQVCKFKATRRWVEQVNLQNERFASTKQQFL